MSISNEAVEAAAKALWQTNQHDDAWAEDYSDYESYLRAEATRALEAAAPHMQPTVTTVAELDALPEDAMVRTDAGFYLKEALRVGVSTWVTTNEQHYFKSEDIPLPATVIYRSAK